MLQGAHKRLIRIDELVSDRKIIATVHAHPTMHEAVHEAALASEGRVINS